jgi:hypothetical protein
MIRRIVFALVVILALFLAFEVGAAALGEYALTRAVRREWDLPPSTGITIDSFPICVSLFRNRFRRVKVTWKDRLVFIDSGGGEREVDYSAAAVLYDVGLDLSSLFSGRPLLQDISFSETKFFIGEEGLADMLGVPREDLEIVEGEVRVRKAGLKSYCKVEIDVIGDEGISVFYSQVSMNDEDSGYGEGCTDTSTLVLRAGSLPAGGRLKSAFVEGENIVLEVEVSAWRGYIP